MIVTKKSLLYFIPKYTFRFFFNSFYIVQCKNKQYIYNLDDVMVLKQ